MLLLLLRELIYLMRNPIWIAFLFLSLLAQGQIKIKAKDYYLKRVKKKHLPFEVKRQNDSIEITTSPIIEDDDWLLLDYYTIPLEGASCIVPCHSSIKSEYFLDRTNLLDSTFLKERTAVGNGGQIVIQKKFVSNKDYKLFLEYVRDSIALSDSDFYLNPDSYSFTVDWKKLNDVVYSVHNYPYEYWWIDFRAATIETNKLRKGEKTREGQSFIIREVVEIYPDTLCWDVLKNDSLRSFFQSHYLQDEYFDDYPVFGVSPEQIKAYCAWLTNQVNSYRRNKGMVIRNDYRIGNYVELMMLPKKFLDSGKLEIIQNKKFKKLFKSKLPKPYKSEDLILDYPTKPFRVVKTVN